MTYRLDLMCHVWKSDDEWTVLVFNEDGILLSAYGVCSGLIQDFLDMSEQDIESWVESAPPDEQRNYGQLVATRKGYNLRTFKPRMLSCGLNGRKIVEKSS